MNRKLLNMISLSGATLCAVAMPALLTTHALNPRAEAASPQQIDANPVGRQVRVVSFSFNNHPVDEIVRMIDEEGTRGSDLIVLPEAWAGPEPLAIDGSLMQRLSALAKKHRTYIVNSIFRRNG